MHWKHFVGAVLGAVPVFASDSLLAQDLLQELKGAQPFGWFGLDLDNLGDVDGDGLPELVIGAPFEESAGQVYVYSAATGQRLRRLRGEADSDNFGEWVDATGDLDGDGIGDFVVAADENDFAGQNAGRAYAYSGASGTLLWTVEGSCPTTFFPFRMSAAGDVDGDGRGDVLFTESGNCVGDLVHVHSGATGARIATFVGEPYSWFGWALSGAGDLDGDGFGDFLVGAPRAPRGDWVIGRAFVYSGRTLAPLWVADGQGNGALGFFGGTVADLGDLDADGLLEVGIADQLFHSGDGRVYVYRADGRLEYTLDGQRGQTLGGRLAAAGDVDRDGYGDLMVLAPTTKVGVYSGDPGGGHAPLFWFLGKSQDGLGAGMAGLGDVDGDGLSDLAIGAYQANSYTDYLGRVYVYSGPRYPVVAQVTPARTHYSNPVSVTLTGANFTRGRRTQVWFGAQPAANVQVRDDSTITCDVPASVPGPVRVRVKNNVGTGFLANGFAYTPALILEGNFRPGGSLLARYLVDPGDQVFAIFGFPPPVSIPWPPFFGSRCIDPFGILFLSRAGPGGEIQWTASLPDAPGTPPLQVLFQALAGPDLTGTGRSGAWTNCTELTIEAQPRR